MEKSRLLMKNKPLVVDRDLATLIGLNEAIVLQQIEYWVNIKEESDQKELKTKDQNYVDGHYWTYNSVEDWTLEFPFWSYDTVKRTLKKLRDNDLVVTGNYNDLGADRTIWYRPNHAKLIELEPKLVEIKKAKLAKAEKRKNTNKKSNSAKCTNEENSQFSNEKSVEALKTDNSAKCTNGLGQNAPMDQGNMHQPIPKTSPKTSPKISPSSSSKGETPTSIHPLVELFNGSICELKKTTTVKFMKYVEKYDKEFIEAMIAYCEERNAHSYSYFAKAIERYINDGITTVADMEKSIENFKGVNKKRKNNALKAKDEVKNEEDFDSYINDRAIDDMLPEEKIEEKVALEGEDVNSLKEKIKTSSEISEVSFNTWINTLDLRLKDGVVVAGCPNGFSKEIITSRYKNLIIEVMKENHLGNNLELVVVK